MTWHIFRKDWMLLWPYVVLLAAAYVLNTVIWLTFGHFGEPEELELIAMVYPFLVDLGIALVVFAAVHQDPIPGDRQDWLVRPIRRQHLLLAKLIFIGAAVIGPLLVVDIITVLMTGFSASDAIRNSAGRMAGLMCLVCLPALSLALVTGNLMQACVGAASTTVAILAFLLVLGSTGLFPPPLVNVLTVNFFLIWATVGLVATLVVLGMQYVGRHTASARIVLAGAVLVGSLCLLTPWKPVFALHSWLVPGRDAESPVIAFDPARSEADPSVMTLTANLTRMIGPGHQALILPLRIDGIPADAALFMARAHISLFGTDGKLLYRRAAHADTGVTYSQFNVRQGTDATAPVQSRQVFFLPSGLYATLKDRPMRMEIEFSLTLIARQSTATLSAVGENTRLPDGRGWCKTKADAFDVTAACLTPNRKPDCRSALIENPVTGQRNPETFYCAPVYTAVPGYLYPMVLGGYGTELAFRDPNGLAKYPVDETQIDRSRILLTGYRQTANMTRRTSIPEIRLGDWVPQTPEAPSTHDGR